MLTIEETGIHTEDNHPAPDLSRQYLAWLKAATLVERNWQEIPATEIDLVKIPELLSRWRSRSLLKNDELFKLRLTEDNLSELQFGQLMTESDEALLARFPELPTWVHRIAQTLENQTMPTGNRDELLPVLGKLNYPQLVGFLEVARPFIQRERLRLHLAIAEIADRYSHVPFDLATIEDILLGRLTPLIIDIVTPTLVMELNVARVKGVLKGATPEDRFNYFIGLLSTSYGQALLQEYPVLARQLDLTVTNWVNYALEIVTHLCQDWSQLVAMFSPSQAPGVLTKVLLGQGDYHRQGRSVAIIEFSAGLKLVYKPHSLGVDVHFQALLQWLNARGNFPTFQTLHILNRPDYGWVEFVEVAPCTTPQQVEYFYRRQGAYLALLYTFGSNDFHAENIIAAGEHPVLIDLETLFQPHFDRQPDGEIPRGAVTQTSNHTVLKVGLLPQKVFSGKNSEGIELSGLGGEEGQVLPQPAVSWEKCGTDEMYMALKPALFQSARNRPTLHGERVNTAEYTGAIAQGFSDLYQLLCQYRDELLAVDGPIQKFQNDSIRVVLRSTYFYALIRQHSFQANNLRDGRERDRLFDKLWNGVKNRPGQWRTIPAERADLQQGDVPFFTAQVCSRDLYTSRDELIPDFLNDSSLEFVQQRLGQMGENDLNRQLWFIRASLTTFAKGGESVPSLIYRLADLESSAIARPSDYLAAACQLGDRLINLALRSPQDMLWMGLLQNNMDQWGLEPLGINLYDGMPGIVLFLAYLGKVSQNPTYTEAAKMAWQSTRQLIETNRTTLQEVGAFEGWGGLCYTLLHLSALWDEPALLTEAVELVEVLRPLIDQDKSLDLISGLAGCLTVLIELYQASGAATVLSAAMQCGERLLAASQAQSIGTAWKTHMPASQPATGLGRGSTGMGLALLQLTALTGDERFREVGLGSLAYERSVFQAEMSNWPDFRLAHKDRLPEGEYRYSTAWCHGAPGIGLARLAILPYLDSAELRDEIEAALTNTAHHGFGANHSLCHGDLGNLDLLIQANQKLNDPKWQAEQDRIATAILNSTKQYGWLCSTPLGVETPGFMIGLAGIGYGFLRLADPTKVPSVLSLEPPHGQP